LSAAFRRRSKAPVDIRRAASPAGLSGTLGRRGERCALFPTGQILRDPDCVPSESQTDTPSAS
jgi:hypothetical protein